MKMIPHDNWSMIRNNLIQADGDMRELDAWLACLNDEKVPDGFYQASHFVGREFSVGVLSVFFQHIYHHVNFAWNSRLYPTERVIKCAEQDFNRWSRFPNSFPRLVRSRSQRGKRREVYSGKLNYFTLRMNVREAKMFLEEAIKGVECRIENGDGYSDADFKRDIELTLMHLNIAWHCHRHDGKKELDLAENAPNYARNYAHWMKYPSENLIYQVSD